MPAGSAAIFTAILPKKAVIPKPKRIRKELRQALGDIGDIVKKDLEGTTETWNRRVEFAVKTTFKGDSIFVRVTTDNEVWGYLDKGTKGPYPIYPVRAQMLRFQPGYRAKTTPKQLTSRSGGPYGAHVFSAGVMHPGIKARHWTKTVITKRRRLFRDRLRRGLKRAVP